jgi:predicted O-methyltransferase YrrM
VIVAGKVEAYLESLRPRAEGVRAKMEAYGRKRDFPFIGPLVGPVLSLLSRSIGARRVFECGSGFGYSALFFAEAVGEGGEVVLTDRSEENLAKAREFLEEAGLAGRCRFLAGDALALLATEPGLFDAILVDIDKAAYPASLAVTVPRLRPGGLLLTDNLLWSGHVADGRFRDAATLAIREYNRLLHAHPDLESVILPLRDGLGVSRRR